jgi:two-component system, cell cycle sensor histidine kinase and response regulator CckA
MNTDKLLKTARSGWSPLAVIAVTTLAIIAISIYCLASGYFIIFQNLFYIPIIIACVYYARRGFAFSVIIACLYFLLIITFTRESSILLQAFVRVFIFALVAGVITYLSLARKRVEESLRRKHDDLEVLVRKRTAQLEEDIAKRKQAEIAKDEQRKELVSILDKFNKSQSIAKIGTLELDVISGKVWWSDELYRIFEVDPEKYIPSLEANAKFVHPDDNEPFHKAVFKAIETGDQIDYVIRIITPSGKLKICKFLANIIPSENKTTVKMIGTVHDITEGKQAEEELNASEAKFRGLFEWMGGGIQLCEMVFDEAGRPVDNIILDVNPAYEKHTGIAREQVVGKRIKEILPIMEQAWLDRYGKLVRTREPIHFEEYSASLDRWFEVHASPMDGNRFAAFFNDITKSKQAENALRESKALVEAVVENVPLMIFLKEAADLRFVIFNRAGEELLGYDRTVLLGKNNLDLFPAEQAAHFMAKDREVLDGEAGMLDIPEEPILTAKKGQRLLHTRKVCIRGADGTTKYLLGISEDITERKQAEENQKKLEEQLRQSQKLEAVGQLSSGVAHDFNNLLGGIMGHAELVKRDLPPGSESLTHSASIITLCEKAADLTRQLLSFARKAPVEFRKIDLSSFIKQVAGLLEHTIDRSIQICVEIKAPSIFILGDRNQLENAILNIAINARDAMPGGGHLSMVLETVTIEKQMIPEMSFEAVKGPYALLSIADTGTGMSKEIKDRIFEPFFTTKEVGKGTGLGLASVYGCVKQHNGHINVESLEDIGTRFDLYFPISTSDTSVSLKEEGLPLPGKGRLLLVDDEAVFHENFTKFFEPLGYTMHCCSDGIEAVEYFRKNYPTIDVVILDMNMPKMSGLLCFRSLKNINPHVKVIVSSGYGENEDRTAMRDEGVGVFMQKPYNTASLAKKIKELINTSLPPTS